MMDFHAHLSNTEVIGVLGGVWNADSRMLRCPFSTSSCSILLPVTAEAFKSSDHGLALSRGLGACMLQ
jgi:hypothetical protein